MPVLTRPDVGRFFQIARRPYWHGDSAGRLLQTCPFFGTGSFGTLGTTCFVDRKTQNYYL